MCSFYGIVGVALATLIPNLCISLTVNLYIYKQYLKITYLSALYSSLTAIVIGTGIYLVCHLLMSNDNLIDSFTQSILCFSVMSVIFYYGFTNSHEKAWILSLPQKILRS